MTQREELRWRLIKHLTHINPEAGTAYSDYIINLAKEYEAWILGAEPEMRPEIPPLLLRPVDDLDMTVRSQNVLKSNEILYIGDLVQKSERDLLKLSNLGKRTFQEIIETLGRNSLSLDMKIEGWHERTRD